MNHKRVTFCIGFFINATFVLFIIALVASFSGKAFAGGLYLNEFGTPSMGTAGAGSAAVANDASTAFHNPAGMTRIQGSEMMATAGFLYADIRFDPDADTPIDGGSGGGSGGFGPILGGFYVHNLTDDWKLGASLISISGSVLDYDDDWTGRYQATDVTLTTVTFMPSIAYRVNDWLSVGGGPQIMYANLELKLKAPPPGGDGTAKIDGDDLTYGFALGALVELSERTRIGVVYQSEIEPDFDGDTSLSPPGLAAATDTKITLARFIRVSGYHELNDQWALVGTVGWEDWSKFENINVSGDQGTQRIPRNWDDTWKFAAGVHFRPVEKWLFQLGISYDTSPADSDDRTADMPIDRQIRYATGVQYKWTDRLSTGAQFVYADYGSARIKNDNLLKGDYKANDIYFFAVNLNWKL